MNEHPTYIYVHVQGGIVQDVRAPEGVEVVVVDEDADSALDPIVTAHHGCRCADENEAAATDRAAAAAFGLVQEGSAGVAG